MEEMIDSTNAEDSSLTEMSENNKLDDNDKSLNRSEKCTVPEKSSAESRSSAINALLKMLPELDKCFHIHHKIGEGTFSNVYLGSLKKINSDKKFAIKHLVPTTHPKRMVFELDCLMRIGGKDNVVDLEMAFRHADCAVFIMPYLQHRKFGDYVLDMDVAEARLYMKNLFLALKRVHSFNIIHRDVKPSNFLYNRESKKFLLVDFGLAQRVNECNENSKLNPSFPIRVVAKRKREDDDGENVEKPAVKRFALQTLSNGLIIKQPARPSVGLRYPKPPLSAQQRKCQQAQESYLSESKAVKRLPLTTNSSNIIESNDKEHNQKQEFQSLLPQKIESGASFIRVQNSQVQAGLFPRPTAPVWRKDCGCSGKPQVCNICLTRKALYAPRAGTPGFRPPEVLLKYPNQTTAVDMWAAGVIMLCILSGCYPFFRCPDDITALADFMTLFGASNIIELARKLGRNIIHGGPSRKAVNLHILCENIRRRKMKDKNKISNTDVKTEPLSNQNMCYECYHSDSPEYGCLCETKTKLDLSNSYFPSCAFDLLSRLLDVDPYTRISAEKALEHPFITAKD